MLVSISNSYSMYLHISFNTQKLNRNALASGALMWAINNVIGLGGCVDVDLQVDFGKIKK